jgi:hypothetical protein
VRVLLDTNILLSALLVRGTPPDKLYEAWRDGHFELVSSERQLEEVGRVSRRPFFAARLKRSEVGRMVNAIRRLALMHEPAGAAAISPDPDDDHLLAVANAADADFLVTGPRVREGAPGVRGDRAADDGGVGGRDAGVAEGELERQRSRRRSAGKGITDEHRCGTDERRCILSVFIVFIRVCLLPESRST